MKTIISVDPGSSGGIAWKLPDGSVCAVPMPDTDEDVVSTISNVVCAAVQEGYQVEAHVERVGGFVAGNPAPGSAMFKFGFSAGVIEGALRALEVRTVYVLPRAWQKKYNLGTKKSNGGTTTVWKNRLKAEAQRRFPNIKVTLKTADALLILDQVERDNR